MPIRLRLALWHSAIFGIALAVFGCGVYLLMASHLEDMVEETVASHAEHLAAAVSAADHHGAGLTIPPLDSFEAPEVYVQVLDPGGAVLARSSNLGGQSLPLPNGGLRKGTFSATVEDTSLFAALRPVPGEAAWVQVAAPYRQRDLVLGRLQWALLGGGLAAVVLVGGLSAGLAGRALRPVADMTETARAIALSRGFNRRLHVGNPRDELGRLAQTFNEMLASLESAYSAQQRFTADASHELRAPLTVIRGNLDLLERVQGMPEHERRQTIENLRREVERLSRLVADLLTLARADAGYVMEMRPVELDAVLVEVHRQARSLADGVFVLLDGLEPAVVCGDRDALQQLLLILVDNALRYTPTGGTVTLGMHLEPPWAMVTVNDTGMGIEPQDLPHVFQRFWRADRARSRDSGGTGLGLAIARWISDRHGGEILVGSIPGLGSCFTVRLPMSTPAQ